MAQARRGVRAGPRWERWSAVTGLFFVALFVAWLNLYGALEPAGGQPRPGDAQILADIVAGDRRLHLAHFVVGLAAICFLSFLGSLRATLQRAEGEPASLSAVAFAAGVVIAILMLLAGALLPGLADVLRRGGTLEPRVVGAFYDVVGAIFSLVQFAVVVLVGATSLVVLRSRAAGVAGLGRRGDRALPPCRRREPRPHPGRSAVVRGDSGHGALARVARRCQPSAAPGRTRR